MDFFLGLNIYVLSLLNSLQIICNYLCIIFIEANSAENGIFGRGESPR